MTSSERFVITQPVMLSKKLKKARNASQQGNAGAAVAAPWGQAGNSLVSQGVQPILTVDTACDCRMQFHSSE